jgi:hypothetical protein
MSLRERLRDRQLPETTVWLRVDFGPESQAAEEALASARQELNLARIRDGDDIEARQAAVDEAQARMDEFCEKLVLRALPPADVEALIAAHPVKDKDGDDPWAESFKPALIAACVQGDETEDEWAQFLATGQVTTGEARSLFAAAMQVNDRSSDLRVGKGA